MSKYHEKERKINILKSGGNVRPPKNWYDKIMPSIRNQYPERSEMDREQILGGIWNNYSVETKIKIINEYQTDNKSIHSIAEERIIGKRNL